MTDIEAEQRKTLPEVAAFLRTLADELDGAGAVTLRLGDRRVTVAPPETVRFGVEVEAGPDGGSFEVELEWPAE